MEDNRVKVRIYGQDYIISGERDEETIREIAAFVDSSIREVSKYFSGNAQGSLAVLAAVNITDELFETREKIAALTAARELMESEIFPTLFWFASLISHAELIFLLISPSASTAVFALSELFADASLIRSTNSLMLAVMFWVCSASLRISSATTANPFPASPARAASMDAFSWKWN